MSRRRTPNANNAYTPYGSTMAPHAFNSSSRTLKRRLTNAGILIATAAMVVVTVIIGYTALSPTKETSRTVALNGTGQSLISDDHGGWVPAAGQPTTGGASAGGASSAPGAQSSTSGSGAPGASNGGSQGGSYSESGSGAQSPSKVPGSGSYGMKPPGITPDMGVEGGPGATESCTTPQAPWCHPNAPTVTSWSLLSCRYVPADHKVYYDWAATVTGGTNWQVAQGQGSREGDRIVNRGNYYWEISNPATYQTGSIDGQVLVTFPGDPAVYFAFEANMGRPTIQLSSCSGYPS